MRIEASRVRPGHLRWCVLGVGLWFVLGPGRVLAQTPGQTSQEKGLIFTASDFPTLADGIEPGLSGDVPLRVWSPARQEWKLAQDGDTATLSSTETGGDPQPRWQKLGKLTFRTGHPLKIVVQSKKKAEAEKTKAKEKEEPAAVPTLMALGTDAQIDTERILELARGRTDSTEPSPDLRRTTIRTNQQGADFQPPSTALAWRDRAAHLREQMLVALGLWPMPPKTPLNPQRLRQASRAMAIRSRRWFWRRSPGSRSAATSTGRRSRRAGFPASSARTATGLTAA